MDDNYLQYPSFMLNKLSYITVSQVLRAVLSPVFFPRKTSLCLKDARTQRSLSFFTEPWLPSEQGAHRDVGVSSCSLESNFTDWSLRNTKFYLFVFRNPSVISTGTIRGRTSLMNLDSTIFLKLSQSPSRFSILLQSTSRYVLMSTD